MYDNNGARYCRVLLSSVRVYIEVCNESIKLGRHLGDVLGKANTHSLVELDVPTVPILDHALLIFELVLEMVHSELQ